MAKQGEGKAVYKRAWFWGAVVVVLYALAGFVGLPWWLERNLPNQTAQFMGWQTSVENISINPFAMTVEVTGLAAQDANEEPVLAFDRFYVDLGFWRLVTGVLAFDTIELDDPRIRLDLLEDYNINFSRDWQAHNPPVVAEEPTEDTEAPSAPPKVYLGELRIVGGELLFRDFSTERQESFSISPLDLALNDLATYTREGGNTNYTLDGALGGETTFSWEGSLSVIPLHSKGHLRIGNVDSATIGHFLRDVLPYTLADGSFSVESDYELASGDRFSLVTSDGSFGVKSLALAIPGQDGDPELTVGDVTVDGIRFSLVDHFAAVGTVAIDSLNLSAIKATDGDINWLRPLAPKADTEDETPEPAAGDTGGFRWSVAEVKLANSQVNWRDEQLDTPAVLALQGIELSIGKLSQQLEEPVPYEVTAGLAGGGTLRAQGQATLVPFTLQAGVSAGSVALAQFEPYLQSATTLEVRDGALTVDGDLNLDGQKDPLTGTFSGNGELTALDLALKELGEPLIGWQTLRLSPIEYNLTPARLEIGTVTLSSPRVNVTKLASGENNLALIAKSSTDDDGSDAGEDDSNDGGLIFRIGQFDLSDGKVSYTDRSISPTFETQMHELEGTVTGLSNIAPQEGTVAITGRLGELGRLNFGGSLGAIGGEDTTELKVDLKQLSLPALSPYFGRYLGYNVDSGKLELDLNYTIQGKHLRADNLVVLDQLELGQEVDSDEAINAPIELGLALLRDRDGVIEVDLPVEGDLNDPEFRVGRVVARAFVNLLVKAAASPFSMLGSVAELAGLSGEELGTVYFEPGSTALDGEESRKLDALASALSERNDLLLNIRGAVSPELDGLELKRRVLAGRIGLADGLSAQQRIDRLEQNYASSNGNEALETLRNAKGSDPQQWEIALVTALTESITLPPEALGNLALARGNWLQRQLLDQYGIKGDQLFLRDPQLNAGSNDQRQVAVEFGLDVR